MSEIRPELAGRARDEPRLTAWERRTDWPLTGLAALFLIGYAASVLLPGLAGPWRTALQAVLWGTWAVFAVDYVVRLRLARRRWRFIRRHVLDLLMIVLPMFRQLRVLRVFTAMTVLDRQLRDDLRGRVTVYVSGATALISFVAALAVYDAERGNPDSSITSFGEALWWTVTTITTVGYGDRYPVTTEGRVVAGALMLAGIALLGVVTASIASWFVEQIQGVRETVERSEQVTRKELLDEMVRLHARLDALEHSRAAD
ncbi:MAG: ion channel [Pseudonocardiaceae bacterium]